MYNIRHRFNPSNNMHMPKMTGSAPADWWGVQEDRDLMIGICRYGYLQYSSVWADPDLCFHARFDGTANDEASEMEDQAGEEVDEIEPEALAATSEADALLNIEDDAEMDSEMVNADESAIEKPAV
jgi:hypothetical protein